MCVFVCRSNTVIYNLIKQMAYINVQCMIVNKKNYKKQTNKQTNKKLLSTT